MPGIKPKNKVKIKWSPEFAYAIGLLTTDGCLSKDSRHIDLTSKDTEQLDNFKKCLGLKTKIGYKESGSSNNPYYRVQFGDVVFYKFLLSIGLTQRKSKTIGEIKVPSKYFRDFLRGTFDGDGSFYSYWDKRWRSSFMFYISFISASTRYIKWLKKKNREHIQIKGAINANQNSSVYQLRYAKKESLKIIKFMYYNDNVICLTRKKKKIEKAIKKRPGGETGIHAVLR